MKMLKAFYRMDMFLGALLFLTVISLIGCEPLRENATLSPSGRTALIVIHDIAGTLFLTGCFMHIAMHSKWIRTLYKKAPWQKLSVKNRLNRGTDLWLTLVTVPCTISGIVYVGLQIFGSGPGLIPIKEWADLHRSTGMLMIMITGLHLVLHLGWMVKTSKCLIGKAELKKEVGIQTQ